MTVHRNGYREDGLREAIEDYDRRREAAQPYREQRYVEMFGKSEPYGWSEDKARQYAVPERADFRRLCSGARVPARLVLIHLRAGELHRLRPLLGLVGEEFAERRRASSTSGAEPSSAKRALIFGSARIALVSRLSFATMSAGVPFGTPMPHQVPVS